MLREEFLGPLGFSAGAVAKAAGIPRTRIERITREETGISADTALRLGKVLGTSAEFWVNLQTAHELALARATVHRSPKALTVGRRPAVAVAAKKK